MSTPQAAAAAATQPARLIRCMNVKYSPNLGDGLLSECLEAALIRQGGAEGLGSIDLAARGAYGDSMAGRGTIMSVLDAMPDGLRHLAVRLPLALASRRKWAPHYEQGLDGAEAVVIGGGNLLSDHDLNFPTKLALALRAAQARGLPVAIYACGMAGSWTSEGDRRLRSALAAHPPVAVFLRDRASVERWNARFADVSGCRAEIVRDPGLLACDTWGTPERARDDAAPHVGLGLMSHVAVRYHGETAISEAELNAWYLALARCLVGQGARVTAFTNGSPEDRATAEALAPELAAAGVAHVQPETPAALSDTVASFDALVAFRMHAVIAAYSHAIPALALSWDDKLDAFMDSVDRLDWMGNPATLAPEEAAARLLAAAAEGVDPTTHARVISEARADIGRLYQAIA